MSMTIETIGVIVVAFILLWVAYQLLKTVGKMVINAIAGILLLVISNLVLGLGIGYSWIVVFVCAVGGFAGAIIIILLHYAGIVL
ncbi:MAG TPA: pro-sigmaK processing inhibitor BofA family protein [Anaerovoracaceae bacterium]|nr:pro-sigmaK processing inhibitor BofA family protein [Anaerovoracaceae bacterium]